jgi:hypothetical protein
MMERGVSGGAALLGLHTFLGLAAAPSFACMALVTSVHAGGAAHLLCTTALGPLGGMAPMYWLMSAFHLRPWLKLMANGRRSAVAAPALSSAGSRLR